jgi:hypothetical protein
MAERPRADICQRTMGETSLSGYGPVGSVNRLVRTRLLGGVGAGGEKPPATRLALFLYHICYFISSVIKIHAI